MALRRLHRPHVLLVVFLMAMLAAFTLIAESGVGRSILNFLIVASIVVSLHRIRVRRSGVLIVAALGARDGPDPRRGEGSRASRGDVVPVSSGARAAVILEEFVGVLYVALVISRFAAFTRRASRGLSWATVGL